MLQNSIKKWFTLNTQTIPDKDIIIEHNVNSRHTTICSSMKNMYLID